MKKQTNRASVWKKACPGCGKPSDATEKQRARYQHLCRACNKAKQLAYRNGPARERYLWQKKLHNVYRAGIA